MFKMLMGIFVGILVGCCLMLVAFNYHIVVAEDTTLFVPKQKSQLTDAYIDIRKWTASDWSQHPDFATAMIKAGHQERIKTSIASDIFDGLFRGLQPQKR